MTNPRFQQLIQTVLLAGAFHAAQAQVNVLTRDYDSGRTGANLAEAQLTVANVTKGSFGALGTFPVDGQIFSQPLYVSGLVIHGRGRYNVLFVTTERNMVYAYDADSAANPHLLWRSSLGPAVPSTALPSDAASGPFIDVNPEVGILSTGVIDLPASVLYVVADILTETGPMFQLHALDLATGQERMNGPVNITASFAGNGAASVSGVIPFDPALHIQRPGLLLANGAVYVAFGSHSDFEAWHGWLISYDASDLTQRLGVLQTTPDGRGGAIWQSGRGLAADDAGNVYFVTGNGDYDGIRNFSESFVRVFGAAASFVDWYTPANWQFLSDNDYDISAGPAILPGSNRIIGGDKSGRIYLVNKDSMGHLDTGQSAQVVQAVGGFIFSLALWARPDATFVYLREKDSSIKSFRVTGEGFDPNPVSVSNPLGGRARIGMALTANGSQDGTGILWVTTGDYFESSTPAILHAFDASNLANELWNSATNPGDYLNGCAKFVTPTVANGKVYAAGSNAVVAYGLLTVRRDASRRP